eukprot:Protomagalhaensia_sp_Gyna_25__1594@NODE_1821_length_1499_cov_24_158219_g1496_i0_p2_GENE_NODE_1821_length_1499_cov_24_158219_g1496_i0NODE_1821_length_1499_cov_24_158219_g1496_i0_p2_ORF_typecomplete_len197_score23_27DUF677/PF05055_12/0_0049SdpI/PF13630_6/3_6e03SdpI/PF13630_6/0_63Phage_holin_3_6/PF07332_11/8_1e02Phage_holin_3_6/PF07332_11/0_076_NODE_1821_length_1499_cov_24_158219_g1496_i08781468
MHLLFFYLAAALAIAQDSFLGARTGHIDFRQHPDGSYRPIGSVVLDPVLSDQATKADQRISQETQPPANVSDVSPPPPKKQDNQSQDFMATLQKQWSRLQQHAAPMVEQAGSLLKLNIHRFKRAIANLEVWQAVLVVAAIVLLLAALTAAALRCAFMLAKLVCCPCTTLMRSRRHKRQERAVLRMLPGLVVQNKRH